MKKVNFNKLYGTLGKALCGCAGAIVGFLIGGPLVAIPGVLAGTLGGRFLEKQLA